jgi:hypothetical protein
MTSEAPLGTPGPFEVRTELTNNHFTSSAGTIDPPATTADVPRRRYECDSYELCLGLAGALNWESFTCRGCSGQPSENLLWRARLSARKDTVAARILNVPPIVRYEAEK